MTLRNAFGDLASEATLEEVKTAAETLADIQANIKALTDAMLYMTSAMLEKMPRLDSADRMMVRVLVNGENDIASAWGGVSTNYVGSPTSGQTFYRQMEPFNFADAGSARIYQNIQVTP